MLDSAKPIDILFVNPLAGKIKLYLEKVSQEFCCDTLLSYKLCTNITYSVTDSTVIAQLNSRGRQLRPHKRNEFCIEIVQK